MKRLSTGLLTALVAVGIGTTSVSAGQSSQAKGNIGTFAPATIAQSMSTTAMPPADFGTPPSGEVPILFNDRHVYSKPDRLKANRVLAALVRGNTILIPLRSMFEQMGATVSYDPGSKTVDVSKPGSDVKVTVGRPEVVINGESRPLDVPPEIYKGAVVVPVRVISEGMGAYVQWVPDRRIVVVRYVPAPVPTAPPTAAPTPRPATPVPTVAPTPVPTPTPVVRNPYEHFIVGDYIFNPKVYNELSPGNTGKGGSYRLAGAVEFPAFGLPWMLEGDYRSFSYPHNSTISAAQFAAAPDGNPCPHTGPGAVVTAAGDQGCVTVLGQYGQVPVASFTARDTDFDGRLGLKIAEPRIYIGVGYLHREENYGYPKQNGFGFGAEKLPDLDQTFSVYGSVYYYPSVTANYTYPAGAPLFGQSTKFQYRVVKFAIGGTLALGNSGLFLDGGFLGDSLRNKAAAPSDATHAGAYLGLGLKF